MNNLSKLLLAGVCLAIGNAAWADEITRHPLPNFPTSLAVEVPAGASTIYLNGVVPGIIDNKADPRSEAAYGNTAQQTANVLAEIEKRLKSLGLGMSDVVKMQVFLKAPQGQNDMDFRGFSQSYLRFFDAKAGVKLPARSLLQTQGFANPGWLVEIDVIAARPAQNR
ncbi:Rid family hydrolase [Uruburuella suis]|jgi:enamine deaminase RidA (YjgF/YER057c/UK114 family)|uniref:Rid family hydrolase n=1 Tax=Uruburuella suis TaxID=252130 RepID=UPI0024926FDE|nr:Rid family hydrolase [Uruburuella suis]